MVYQCVASRINTKNKHMKKIIYLLSISFLMLQACSTSNNNSDNSNSIILCKRQLSGNAYFDYTYDGNKILTTKFNGLLLFKYYYTGDLITKVESYDGNELSITSIFTYNNNNQLISEVGLRYLPEPSGYRRTFSYNSNNTISTVEYSGTLSLQNTIIQTGTITLINGEEAISSNLNIETNTIFTRTKTYDDKNSPFKNILGADKLFLSSVFGFGGKRNPVSITNSYPTISNITINYQYNDQGYPLSQFSTNGNSTVSFQYFY